MPATAIELVPAIVLWNTVYLERAVAAIRQTGQLVPDELLAHLSPLKWEHINLTGDYDWRKDAGLRNRKLRPLRASKPNLNPCVQFLTNGGVTPLMTIGGKTSLRVTDHL